MSGRPSTAIQVESCWNCRNCDAGKVHGTLQCDAHHKIVRGPEREGCDKYKDSRKHSEVVPAGYLRK